MFRDPPLKARRQPPNLKTLLTSSKLGHSLTTGNKKCGKPRCQVCQFIITDQSFTPPGSRISIRPPSFDCDTPNVVYLLCCTACEEGNYVGQTGLKFRLRLNNHKKSIIDKVNLPVSNHFCRAGHNLSNLRCILLRSGFTTTTQRLRAESKWILALNTHKRGLNKDLGVLSRFSFVSNR